MTRRGSTIAVKARGVAGRPALALVLLAACWGALIGCGGGEGDGAEGKKRSDPFAGIAETPAARDKGKNAAPRFERLATLTGTGRADKAFTVAPGAIQWRARWRCRTGEFGLAVDPPTPEGKDLVKSRCPRKGNAESIQTGRLRLGVTASGPWRVEVEQQVDTPLHEPRLAGMSDDRLVSQGRFYRIERPGKGTASLYRLPDRRLALRLERFETSANTDLFVWLSEAERPRNTKQSFRAPHREIALLKSTLGDSNYVLPRSVDPDKIRSIVIWCEPVRIAYTAASLEPR